MLRIFEEMHVRGGVLGSLEVNYQRNQINGLDDLEALFASNRDSAPAELTGADGLIQKCRESLGDGFEVDDSWD